VQSVHSVRESYERRISGRTERQTYTMITDIDGVTFAITAHLAYLDSQVAGCKENAKLFKGSTHSARMSLSASVYAEVANELRFTLEMDAT
jgi:hypothetical protein